MEFERYPIHITLPQELQVPLRLRAAEHPSLGEACQIPLESDPLVKMHCLPAGLCLASPQGFL
jgi:hypothetical protein